MKPPTTLDYTLKHSTWVRDIETSDGGVLFDIGNSVCFSVSSSALTIWRLADSGGTVDQITDVLSVGSGLQRNEIYDDVVRCLADFKANHLLMLGCNVRSADVGDHLLSKVICGLLNSGKSARWLVGKVLCWLCAYDMLGLGNDLGKVHRFVSQWRQSFRTPETNMAEHIGRAVNYACVWYPKRVLCLQRSAVTTCLLRTVGVAAEMVIGAQKLPFSSHAWVEVNGVPFNERKDISKFLIVERC